MAVAEEKTSPETSEKSWHGIVLQTLKRNDIRLVPYVPDRVLTTLIGNLHADPFFTTFPTAREEEAVGIVSGAWMGGMRGAVLVRPDGHVAWRMPWLPSDPAKELAGALSTGRTLLARTWVPVGPLL